MTNDNIYEFPDIVTKPLESLEGKSLEQAFEVPQLVRWTELKAKMNEILAAKGAPEIQTYHLQRLLGSDLQTLQEDGSVKKTGGTWVVVPKKIRAYFQKLIDRIDILEIPDHITNTNDLIKLDGIFRWTHVSKTFPPFTQYDRFLPNYIETKVGLNGRDTCGFWFSEPDRTWLLDMKVFVPYFFENIWNSNE